MFQLSDLFHTQSFKFYLFNAIFSIEQLDLDFKVVLHENYLSDLPETYRAYPMGP